MLRHSRTIAWSYRAGMPPKSKPPREEAIRKQSTFQQVTAKLLSLVIRLMINDSIAAHTFSGVRCNDGEGVLQINEEVPAAQVQQRGDDLHSDGDKETDHEHDQHKGDDGIKTVEH